LVLLNRKAGQYQESAKEAVMRVGRPCSIDELARLHPELSESEVCEVWASWLVAYQAEVKKLGIPDEQLKLFNGGDNA